MVSGLGPLEMRVLGLLDEQTGQSVRQVRDRLAQGGQRMAYTTVMTVLGRLHDKQLVRRAKDGNRYLYWAARRAQRFKGGLLRKVQRALFSDRLEPIAALIEEDLDRDELRALKQLIDAKLERK